MKKHRIRPLSLSKVTLRLLTPREIAEAAGGALPTITDVGCWPRTNAWTANGVLCGG